MSMFTEQEAKAILDKVIALSTADECTATLQGSVDGNIRFALNNISTSGVVSNTDLAVQVAFGKRTGVATINEFNDAALERVVRRAEDLAKLAPENPEFVPAIARQEYRASPTFDATTAAITPEYRARVAADSIGPCKADGLIAAGFLNDGQGFSAMANSNGNFAYQKTSGMDYTCTVRTEDGRGSGWVGRNLAQVAKFDAGSDIRTAIRKARDSADAKALEPGKYTVILEPAAAASVDSKHATNDQVPAVIDVTLHDGGTLRGQVVDAQGKPLAGSPLSIRQIDREVARVVSDQSGYFQATGLRGGMYQILAGEATGVYRLWAPRTAPPSAQPGALVVVAGKQVLGQGHRVLCWLRNPWVIAGIVAAAIAIPVAIHNAEPRSK